MVQSHWKTVWWFLINLSIQLIPIQPRNCTIGHSSQGNENLCSYKTCMSMYSSFIHSHPKLATAQLSFNRCMNKQTVVHLHQLLEKRNTMDKSQTLSERTQTPKLTCEQPHLVHPGEGKAMGGTDRWFLAWEVAVRGRRVLWLRKSSTKGNVGCCACVLSPYSRILLHATPRTGARQTSLSMRFSRQEHWRRLPRLPGSSSPRDWTHVS